MRILQYTDVIAIFHQGKFLEPEILATRINVFHMEYYQIWYPINDIKQAAFNHFYSNLHQV